MIQIIVRCSSLARCGRCPALNRKCEASAELHTSLFDEIAHLSLEMHAWQILKLQRVDRI